MLILKKKGQTQEKKVSYAKAKDIDFTSAKRLKENLDKKIGGCLEGCDQDQSCSSTASST